MADDIKIKIGTELDASDLEQQVNNAVNKAGGKKVNIGVNVNPNGVKNFNQNMNNLNTTATKTKNIFSNLGDTIGRTFSTSRLTMTAFLSVIGGITKASREAIQVTDELSDAITNLAVATNSSREGATNMVRDYNKMAQDLKVTTTTVTDAADRFLRSGEDIKSATELIQDSVVLSKLGNISSDEASSGIMALKNGFELTAEEVTKAVDEMTSAEILVNSTSGDMVKGLSYAASMANEVGLSFTQLNSMFAITQSKTAQSASVIGSFLNTMLARYRDIKIGKYLSEDGEDLSDYINVLHKVGVDVLDETTGEFREFGVVIEELSKKFNTLSSIDKAAVLKQMAGTRQQNRMAALLSSYDEVLGLIDKADESTSAFEKYQNVVMDSLEAKQENLRASFEALVLNSDLSEVRGQILDATTSLIEFINSTNALKGVTSGVAFGALIKGFLSIRTGISQAYIGLNKFQNALNMVNKGKVSTQSFQKLLLLTNNLGTSQTKLVLSSKNLTKAQRMLILMNQGLSKEEAKAQLEAWGLMRAQTGLTLATTTLGNAIKGLWNTLKANPIILISTLVSGAVMAWQSYNQKIEETRREHIELAKSSAESADELNKLYAEYTNLNGIQERTTDEEEQFKTAVDNITKSLGDKATVLEGLTEGTEEYTKALEQATKQELLSQLSEVTQGRTDAEDALSDKAYSKAKGNRYVINTNGAGKSIDATTTQAIEVVRETLAEYESINRSWNNLEWTFNGDDPQQIYEYYDSLLEARDKLTEASLSNEDILDTEIYKDISTALKDLKEPAEEYINLLYQERKLEYEYQNTIPTTVEELEKMKQAMIEASGGSKVLQDYFVTMLNTDFSYLSNNIDTVAESLDSVEDVLEGFSLGTFKEQIDGVQSSISTLEKALESLQNGSLGVGDVVDLMQQFPSLASYIDLTADGFGNLSEGLNKLINTQPSAFISQLEQMKSSLNTEEERAQIDLLIDSLQLLSGYGDTGSEALATSIGSTWDSTANVIENVTNQFSNLQKVQEAVADSLTMSIEKGMELAKVYPEILNNAQISADGQITLNQAVVEDILSGDKSIIDGQIAKLQADKAELEAKKSFAEAQLEMVKTLAESEGQSAKQVAEYRLRVANALVEALIQAGMSEDEAYRAVCENMAGNTNEYARILEEAAQNSALNIDSASISAAQSIEINSINAQSSLSNLLTKVNNVARGIANMGKGIITEDSGVQSSKGGSSGYSYSGSSTSGAFKAVENDYQYITTSLEDFTSELELDISNYELAISNIDNQISTLENLKGAFDNNGSVGGHGYKATNESLKNAKDSLDGTSKSAKGAQKSLEDLAKQRFDDLKAQFEALNSELDHFNKMIDKLISRANTQHKIAGKSFYNAKISYDEQSLANMRSEREALAQVLNESIQNGSVTYGSADYVNLRNQIYDLDEAILDTENDIIELGEKIKEVAKLDFNDLQSQFDNLLGYLTGKVDIVDSAMKYYDTIDKIAGQDFYNALIESERTNIDGLQSELDTLISTRDKYVNDGTIEKGSQDWLEMSKNIDDVTKSLIEANTQLAEYEKKLREVALLDFQDIAKQFDDALSILTGKVNIVDAVIDYQKSAGKIAGQTFYKSLIAQQDVQNQALEQKLKQLQETRQKYLDNGSIDKSTEEWVKMENELDEVEAELWQGKKAAEEYKKQLREVAKLDFEDLKSQFKTILDLLKSSMDVVDATTSYIEESGHMVAESYYKALADAETQNIKGLVKQYNTLVETREKYLADGTIEKYSDEWYEMSISINNVAKELMDSNTQLEKYLQLQRQIKWDIFDHQLEHIKDMGAEAEWMAEIVKGFNNEKLYDDNGAINSVGLTVQGLQVEAYENYLAQAKKYAQERKEVENLLASDPTNIKLEDRVQSLISQEREVIKSAIDMKKTIQDLVKDGYEKLVSAINDSISKLKEQLQNTKNLYDYQKSINDANKNVTDIQKQLLAYQNDDSEEGRAKRQQLSSQLDDAKGNLNDLEFNQSITDQQSALDMFSSELQSWLNAKMDEGNLLIQEAIDTTNANVDSIVGQLYGDMAQLGYDITTNNDNAWLNYMTTQGAELYNVEFATNEAIGLIEQHSAQLPTDLTELIQMPLSEGMMLSTDILSTAVDNVYQNISDSNAQLEQVNSNVVQMDVDLQERVNEASILVSERVNDVNTNVVNMDSRLSGLLEDGNNVVKQYLPLIQSNVVELDRDVTSGFSSLSSALSSYASAVQGAIGECKSLAQEAMNTAKSALERPVQVNVSGAGFAASPGTVEAVLKRGGYATGVHNLKSDELAWTQENGQEAIIRKSDGAILTPLKQGDSVLTAQQTENLYQMAKMNPMSMMHGMDFKAVEVPKTTNNTNSADIYNTSITLNFPNITKRDEFMNWIKNDKNVISALQAQTVGRVMGHNSYTSQKYT